MPENPSPPSCVWCMRSSEFAKVGISTGFKINAWCFRCNKPATAHLSYAKPRFDAAAIERMRWVEVAKVTCPICRSACDGLESHHLAPKAQFGHEAEMWPQVLCCRDCHERWHRKMGQPIDGDHRD